MDFYESLNKFMLSNSKLKAEVKNRIYPQRLPQNPTLPSIIYSQIRTEYDKNLQKESGFVREVVQFTVHDTTFGKVRKVSRIIRDIFKDFAGNMHGINIQATVSLTDMASGSDEFGNEYMWIVELEFQYNCE